MKSIGILGGIGPQATMEFEAQVHRAAQRHIAQHGNTGYPPMVTVYMRHPPVLVDEHSIPTKPLTLDPRLLEAAKKLGEWSEVIVIPSNTPHFFLAEIREASNCELLSMIDLVMEELKARRTTKVGLIGLGIPKIYQERLDKESIEVVTAEPSTRQALDHAIIKLMEGKAEEDDGKVAADAIREVRQAGAPLTILGCTEIPLLLQLQNTDSKVDDAADDLFNPAEILADAVVQYAIGEGAESP